MQTFQNFTESEIPYEALANFGLTQEMIDDLPQSVMLAFLSGRTTPVLPIIVEGAEGEKRESGARVGLIRKQNEDGSTYVDAIFVPIWEDKDLEDFENYQRQELLMGNVILIETETAGQCFAQFDETINQVITVNAELILHNLDMLTGKIQLSDADKRDLYEGKVVEVSVGGNPVSFGIDLQSPNCFRVTNGDALAWKQEENINRLQEYNFGIYGCWKRDAKNHLVYIPEEKYTEQMNEEMRRAGFQNAANQQMRGRSF